MPCPGQSNHFFIVGSERSAYRHPTPAGRHECIRKPPILGGCLHISASTARQLARDIHGQVDAGLDQILRRAPPVIGLIRELVLLAHKIKERIDFAQNPRLQQLEVPPCPHLSKGLPFRKDVLSVNGGRCVRAVAGAAGCVALWTFDHVGMVAVDILIGIDVVEGDCVRTYSDNPTCACVSNTFGREAKSPTVSAMPFHSLGVEVASRSVKGGEPVRGGCEPWTRILRQGV